MHAEKYVKLYASFKSNSESFCTATHAKKWTVQCLLESPSVVFCCIILASEKNIFLIFLYGFIAMLRISKTYASSNNRLCHEYHVNGVILNRWLYLQFIHVIVCSCSLFIFIDTLYSIEWISHNLFMHPLFDGDLSYF